MSRRTSSRLATSGATYDGDDIKRTPEYEEFIEKLQAYHDERGTTLTTVPEIAGRKVNLLELYTTVTSEGGYDKITGTKGAWKDLAESFGWAGNTTNGFLLKSCYYKNLAAYEISKFFNKTPPPKELLEDRSAAGGPIQTRALEEESDDSSSEEERKSPTPPPSTGGRTLRQAPPKREFYQPGITPSRPSSTRSGSNMSGPMQPQNYNGSPPRTMPPTGPPSFLHSNNSQLPFARTVPTPANDPERFAQRRMHQGLPRRQEIPWGPLNLTRSYFGLKSGIDSEIDSSLYGIVRSTYEVPHCLTDGNFPELAELVVDQLSADRLSSKYIPVPETGELEDGLITKELETQLNRISDAALAVRNATIEPSVAQIICELPNFFPGITSLLKLPKRPCFAEIRSLCLDIVETTSTFWVLKPDDPIIEELKQGVHSEDRSVIIRSLRCLANLGTSYAQVEVLEPRDIWIVEHIYPLLMIDDVEMLLAAIQFINKFTSVAENCEEVIKKTYSNGLVKQLIRLLEYDSRSSEEIRPLYQEARKEMPPIPQLPAEIVNDLLTYPEPERAANWMRCCFEEDPAADITQIQLWQAYQQRFTEFVPTGRPLLPAADFIKHVSIAFKNAGAKVVEVTPGQTRFIIRGIRPREAPISPRGVVYLPCKWLYHHGQCKTQVPSANDLYTHVITAHLPRHENPEGQPLTPPVLHCGWNGCTRFGHMGSTDRRAVIAHLRTHMPDKPAGRKPAPVKLNPQNKLTFEVQVPMLDQQGRAAILPLTIVLTLRNFGKSPDGRELLYPHREIICQLASQMGAAQYGRDLSKYLMELFVDSDLDPRENDEEEEGVQE